MLPLRIISAQVVRDPDGTKLFGVISQKRGVTASSSQLVYYNIQAVLRPFGLSKDVLSLYNMEILFSQKGTIIFRCPLI